MTYIRGRLANRIVLALLMVKDTVLGELLAEKLPAGSLNEAVRECLPTASVETVSEALPPAPTVAVPSTVAPSLKVTVPARATEVWVLVTVVVSTTGWP